MIFALKVVFTICAVIWVLMVSVAATGSGASGWPLFIAWAVFAFGPVLVLGGGISALGRWVRT